MGLFSFFIKSPQKAEATGDKYFQTNQFGSAKLEYESALEIIEKKHPDDVVMKERVFTKLKNSLESLARQHFESAKPMEANAWDEAEKLYNLALSLTDNPELQQAIRERIDLKRQRVEQLPVEMPDHEIPDEEADETPDSENPDDQTDNYVESEPEEEPESYNDESEDYDPDHEFDVLCMTLPEEIGSAYQSYGDTFKEGFLALSHGDFALAAECLQKAMEENPSPDSHIPVELATALMNLGQTDQAIEQLLFYLQNHPASFYGISMLCDVYCDLKQFDLAHGVIEKSPEDIKQSSEGSRLDGRIYYLEGDYQKAEDIFSGLLKKEGWDTDIARELAMTHAAAGKLDTARALYTDMLNQCSRCGQRINPLDKKAFADLSFSMNDLSDNVLKIYLELANDHPEIRSECFTKASAIFSHKGDKKEAARFKMLADSTVD